MISTIPSRRESRSHRMASPSCMTLQPVPSFRIPIDYYTDARGATWHMLRLFSVFLLDFQCIVRLLSRRYAPSKLRCDHRLSPRLHAHGCGPWRWTSELCAHPPCGRTSPPRG